MAHGVACKERHQTGLVVAMAWIVLVPPWTLLRLLDRTVSVYKVSLSVRIWPGVPRGPGQRQACGAGRRTSEARGRRNAGASGSGGERDLLTAEQCAFACAATTAFDLSRIFLILHSAVLLLSSGCGRVASWVVFR